MKENQGRLFVSWTGWRASKWTKLVLAIVLVGVPLFALQDHGSEKSSAASSQTKSTTNGTAPSASRDDHVGKPLPDYMTGDQCLFCHRNVVGPTWQQEPHAWTVRTVDIPPLIPQLPKDATHVIGSPQHYRALKLIGYGKFSMLANDGKTWEPDVFATKCAGCHTTGVDPAARTFSVFAFDCYACHGDLSTDHTTKPEEAWLGSKHAPDPRKVVEICAQCHLRGGYSKSTGLPYPDNFIAGDDLFLDFKVDLKREYDPTMNTADRHAYTYTSNVIDRGSTQTCLSCHRIHGQPNLKHEYCIDCDPLPAAIKNAGKLRSETCQY